MLRDWRDFFALTGSAGVTLLRLLLVVVTFGAKLSTSRQQDVTNGVLTPAFHSFAGALAQSMVALAPWNSNAPVVLFSSCRSSPASSRQSAARVHCRPSLRDK